MNNILEIIDDLSKYKSDKKLLKYEYINARLNNNLYNYNKEVQQYLNYLKKRSLDKLLKKLE